MQHSMFQQFQSTSSVWRTTLNDYRMATARLISIHVLRVEDDIWINCEITITTNFNPRPPCGGRLPLTRLCGRGNVFQSTSSVWRTTADRYEMGIIREISIHVLRVEDDGGCPRAARPRRYFNPRPPCGGRRMVGTSQPYSSQFQSTSSVWRTTPCGLSVIVESSISIHVLRVEDDNGGMLDSASSSDFNPRPPCGGRPHALASLCRRGRFQSTSSVWRTTRRPAGQRVAAGISIHVLRVEDDPHKLFCLVLCSDFNPRPPCGGRPSAQTLLASHLSFQSTSSVWRTTPGAQPLATTPGYFNPRPPCGGRRFTSSLSPPAGEFQSTSSVWRTTRNVGVLDFNHPYFNPRPPCGGRRYRQLSGTSERIFQSTSSVWRTTIRCLSAASAATDFNPRPPCGGRPLFTISFNLYLAFQSTSSVWRTT